jgi:hypothetical protein
MGEGPRVLVIAHASKVVNRRFQRLQCTCSCGCRSVYCNSCAVISNLSIPPLLCARQKCPSASFVLSVPSAQLPTRSVLSLRLYFQAPRHNRTLLPQRAQSTPFLQHKQRSKRIEIYVQFLGPQSYLYPLSQLTIFPNMSCVVAEPHVVLTEKEGRHYHYPYSGICGAVRLGLGPSVCEVHTKVRTKVCAKSENLRRNQLKGAEQ